jgi:heptosyltransferase-2
MRKVLIIKTGYAETFLHDEWTRTSSLGDVLRTTTLLHLYKVYKDDEVTWLTDERAVPLLKGNPYIKRLLIWDALTLIQLQHEYFDVVINLEQVPGLAALADNISIDGNHQPQRFGYFFNNAVGVVGRRLRPDANWDSLFGIVGGKYNGEEYILGYKPKTEELNCIGLNYRVGDKWPEKAWKDRDGYNYRNWDNLHSMLYSDFVVERQPGDTNLYDYIDWINKCRFLVTCDSLGLHIAIALKKKVIALFGPTPVFKEAYGLGRQCIIAASGKMEDISVDVVYEGIKYILQYG